MQILNDTLFLADIIAIAVMMHIIAQCVRDDSEKRRLRRREMYRQQAYAEVYRRRMKTDNRDALWKAVNR